MLPLRSKKDRKYKFNSITTGFVLVVMLLSFLSCGGKKKSVGEAVLERDSLAVMHSTGVTTFVSDSGFIRYKVVTEQWDVFDRKTPPYWSFEKGVYLERFDTIFNVEASIKADTAYHYTKEKLWKLIGNVHVMNMQGDTFDTELLYWDQKTGKVYSEEFVTITLLTQEKIIWGYGFESDQDMTHPRIFNLSGTFYFDQAEEGVMPPDSISVTIPVDSVN